MSQNTTIISADTKRRTAGTTHQTSVILKRRGKEATFLLSDRDFEQLTEILDDMWWGSRAMEAMKEGTIGVRKSEALLKKMRNAKR